MNEKFTQVDCKLSDCLFYHIEKGHGGAVFCKHADKHLYLKTVPCPLFRLDWQKKAAATHNLIKKLF